MADLKLSDLTDFGASTPIGDYTAKIAAITANESKGTPAINYVSMKVEFLDGDAKGMTAFVAFFLKITKSAKDDRYYSRGLSDAKQTATAWGQPLNDNIPLQGLVDNVTPAGARAVQKALAESFRSAGSPLVKVEVYKKKSQVKGRDGKYVDEFDDEGKQVYRTEYRVKGRATPKAAPRADESRDDEEAEFAAYENGEFPTTDPEGTEDPSYA